MRINDVQKITGLTKKAIRLYENKGIICISRDENGYRNYSENDIRILKTVRILRSAGISISDIKLYISGVLNLSEVIEKRKAEILKESGKNSESYRICERISDEESLIDYKNTDLFIENDEVDYEEHGDLSVGIDIGTTTVSAVVFDIDNKKQIEAYTVPHNSYVRSDIFCEQSVSVILDKAEKLLYHILNSYSNIISIGLSGQMHGIVYIDKDGNSVSDLINWQDKRADILGSDGVTACDLIKSISGESISTGYGIATHFYNFNNGLVPDNANGFCSVMDLFGMKICGLKKTISHVSVAASFGFFDIESSDFKKEKLSLIGISEDILPCVTDESIMIGKCRGIPVSVAIGDNQASFLGSVKQNEDAVLVNIGTGSQISAVSSFREISGDVELRPFIEGRYLLCGSALCGGFAYSILEQFFRSYISYAGSGDEPQYKLMNKLALEAYENGETGLDVDVSFSGKRKEPNKRGSIQMIDKRNFTPQALILGFLRGMCNELYDLYESLGEKRNNVVVSGGAVRKNDVLKRLIADRFLAAVSVSVVEEEAATGAALFSAFCVGKIKYNNGFSEYIIYN